MLHYRPFLNTDVPLLIEIWKKQSQIRPLTTVLTRQHLDQIVLAKPYFQADGLIMALDDDKPLGFAHFGFGPTECQTELDYSTAVLAQIRVVDCDVRDAVAADLIAKGLAFVSSKGAKQCYAGAKFPFSPFYMGIYGGSRVPGVPEEDVFTLQVCRAAGFQDVQTLAVFQRSLTGFRPMVNRIQLALRRQCQVKAIVDPLLPTWWQCCTLGNAEIFGFQVSHRGSDDAIGKVYFWDIEPLSREWGVATLGLVNLVISEEHRRQGLATFLVGESLRQLAAQNRGGVEVQLRESHESAIGVAGKLGFERISSGTEMRLELGG